MNDVFSDYALFVFPDANVVFEGVSLNDAKWEDIDPVGPIMVLLVPTFLREIDLKKQDGRLGERARDFNRFIAPLIDSADSIVLRESSPRVMVKIADCAKTDWTDYGDLSSTEGDDCFVANVLNSRDAKPEKKLVISQDINPLFVAKRYGIATKRLPDTWLRKPDTSAKDKEISKLNAELKKLHATEPEFEVELIQGIQNAKIFKVKQLEEEESRLLTQSILKRNPKPHLSDPSSAFGFKTHDYNLNGRYSKFVNSTVPSFVSDFHRHLELYFGQIPIKFVIRNSSDIRADHFHASVMATGASISHRALMLVEPNAPAERSQMEQLNLRTQFWPSNHVRASVHRHEIKVSKVTRKKEISAECENFRSGQEWVFEGVLCLDPHFEKSAKLIFNITAKNFHGNFQKVIELTRVTELRHAFDLVDLTTGKLKVDSIILAQIKKAWEVQRYDDVELWPHASDD
jgi:hypothetical protein